MTLPAIYGPFTQEEQELETIRRHARGLEESCANLGGEILLGLQHDEWWGLDLQKMQNVASTVDEIHRAVFRVRKDAEKRMKLFREEPL